MLSTGIFNKTLTFLISTLLFGVVYSSQDFKELNVLTPVQKVSLQKLENAVLDILPHDYMKEDIYLVKFLKFQRYNWQRAEQMVRTAMKWRANNKVDNWNNDPDLFAEFEQDYPIYVDGHDKSGRPIFEIFFGDWDVRSVAVSGKIQKLVNYLLSRMELANIKVRELQAQGKNVTEWIELVNMDGFNLINQGCPTCLPLYVSAMSAIEQYFPNTCFKLIHVNTPASFTSIIPLMRPIMSSSTRSALKIFGTNKEEWKAYIDQYVDPSEISDWFGGHKVRSKSDSLHNKINII